MNRVVVHLIDSFRHFSASASFKGYYKTNRCRLVFFSFVGIFVAAFACTLLNEKCSRQTTNADVERDWVKIVLVTPHTCLLTCQPNFTFMNRHLLLKQESLLIIVARQGFCHLRHQNVDNCTDNVLFICYDHHISSFYGNVANCYPCIVPRVLGFGSSATYLVVSHTFYMRPPFNTTYDSIA